MIITRRNPVNLTDVERAFEALLGTPSSEANNSFRMDIFEKDNTLFVVSALPGLTSKNLSVTAEKGVLVIQGDTTQTWGENSEDLKVYREEIPTGKLSRSLRLPEGYDQDSIEANLTNGLLTVKVKKMAPVEPKKITVTVS